MPFKDPQKYKEYQAKYYAEKRAPKMKHTKNPTFTLCEICGKPRRTSLNKILVGKDRYCKEHRYEGMRNRHPWNYGTGNAEYETEKQRLWSNGQLKEWMRKVKERDDYCCQICHNVKRGKHLHAHHIKSFADYPDDRLDIDNGISLCKDCHYWVHNINPLDFQ